MSVLAWERESGYVRCVSVCVYVCINRDTDTAADPFFFFYTHIVTHTNTETQRQRHTGTEIHRHIYRRIHRTKGYIDTDHRQILTHTDVSVSETLFFLKKKRETDAEPQTERQRQRPTETQRVIYTYADTFFF